MRTWECGCIAGTGMCVDGGRRGCLHDGGIVDAEDVDLVDPSLLKTAVDLGCLEARDLARGSRGRERARERDHQHVALRGERLNRQVLLEVDLMVAREAAASLQAVVETEAARWGRGRQRWWVELRWRRRQRRGRRRRRAGRYLHAHALREGVAHRDGHAPCEDGGKRQRARGTHAQHGRASAACGEFARGGRSTTTQFFKRTLFGIEKP